MLIQNPTQQFNERGVLSEFCIYKTFYYNLFLIYVSHGIQLCYDCINLRCLHYFFTFIIGWVLYSKILI
jgi:hypothetical protein